MKKYFFGVHCHYYQPPRGNPLTGEPLIEPDAAPYENWNQRITDECYKPNAELGNVDLISFNLGETLADWLAAHHPEVYQRYLQADAANVEKAGVGNAIAQPIHHTILPLSREEDVVTQVMWGKAVFAHRFGRPTEGMWLPEMAVNLEVLEILAEQGIAWTILTEKQIVEKPPGAGPFWVDLPKGGRIKVFVRDENLSNQIAFQMGHLGGAGHWVRNTLGPYKQTTGELTLIATDGETFGHHWRGEEHFLRWLLHYEAKAAGYDVITLSDYARRFPPQHTVEIRENTSWSSAYGLARWATGSPDTPGDSSWKGALRRAMDNLRHEIDGVYAEAVSQYDPSIDPVALRDAYIQVELGDVPREKFLQTQEIEVPSDANGRLLDLLEAQYYRQRMYSSCAFFFAELSDLSTRYGIASAAKAIELTQRAVDIDLETDFKADLRIASGLTEDNKSFTGLSIYEEILRIWNE